MAWYIPEQKDSSKAFIAGFLNQALPQILAKSDAKRRERAQYLRNLDPQDIKDRMTGAIRIDPETKQEFIIEADPKGFRSKMKDYNKEMGLGVSLGDQVDLIKNINQGIRNNKETADISIDKLLKDAKTSFISSKKEIKEKPRVNKNEPDYEGFIVTTEKKPIEKFNEKQKELEQNRGYYKTAKKGAKEKDLSYDRYDLIQKALDQENIKRLDLAKGIKENMTKKEKESKGEREEWVDIGEIPKDLSGFNNIFGKGINNNISIKYKNTGSEDTKIVKKYIDKALEQISGNHELIPAETALGLIQSAARSYIGEGYKGIIPKNIYYDKLNIFLKAFDLESK